MGLRDLLRRPRRAEPAATPWEQTSTSMRSLGLRSRRSIDARGLPSSPSVKTQPAVAADAPAVPAPAASATDVDAADASGGFWRRLSSVDRPQTRRLSSDPAGTAGDRRSLGKGKGKRWGRASVGGSLAEERVAALDAVDAPREYAGDRADAARRLPRRGAGDAEEVGVYVDEDEFSSQASTHASRDPFLNDNSSIPESSAGDLGPLLKGDEGADRVLGKDFFAALGDAVDGGRNRDREREKDGGRFGARSALGLEARKRRNSLGDEIVPGGAATSATGGALFISADSAGLATGSSVDALGEDGMADFQPASTLGAGDGRSENGKLSLSRGAGSLSVASSRYCASSLRRRSALWRTQAVDSALGGGGALDARSRGDLSELRGGAPGHERALLNAVLLCDEAVKETNPVAAERIVEVFDSEVEKLEKALAATRDEVSRARKVSLALPAARGNDYEEMLYGDATGGEGDRAKQARVEAEAAFQEFRLMEAVWDIEAAVFERQWHEAVDMIETVRSNNENVLVLGSGSGAVSGGEGSGNSSVAVDRFAAARRQLGDLADHLASELLTAACDRRNGRGEGRYASLLARLGLPEEARRAVLVAGATALEESLESRKRLLELGDGKGRGLDQEAFVALVGARLLAQLCESYATLEEVYGTDKAGNDAAFMTWGVGLVDSMYDKYLASCIDSSKADVFHIAKVVSALRNSTLTVPEGDIFEEVGVVLDTRLSTRIREEVCAALVAYQDALAGRAETAASQSLQHWDGSALVTHVPLAEELQEFVGNVALQLLGIDNGVDSLQASIMTVACGVYAANLLHAVEQVKSTKVRPRRAESLARAAGTSLELLGEALAAAADRDHVLRSNAGVMSMVSQLRSGAMCGADGLRRMGMSSIPPRPRQGLTGPPRVWGDWTAEAFSRSATRELMRSKRTNVAAHANVAFRWEEDDAAETAARELALVALARERKVGDLSS